MSECKTCAGAHDPEIHAATRSIHRWLRAQVRRVLEPLPVPKPRTFTPPSVRDVVGLRLPTIAERKRASRLGARGARR